MGPGSCQCGGDLVVPRGGDLVVPRGGVGRGLQKASTIEVSSCILSGALDVVPGTALASHPIGTIVEQMGCVVI